MGAERIFDDEFAELIRRGEDAISALIRGDMERYLALTPHVRGLTLVIPFGGARAGYEHRTESSRVAAGYFHGWRGAAGGVARARMGRHR